MMTKVDITAAEPFRWYDETVGCADFVGNNVWFYADDTGTVKAYGVGRSSTLPIEKVLLPCEEE